MAFVEMYTVVLFQNCSFHTEWKTFYVKHEFDIAKRMAMIDVGIHKDIP